MVKKLKSKDHKTEMTLQDLLDNVCSMGAFKPLDFSTERYILPEEVIFLAVLRPYVIIHIAVNAVIII